MWLQRIKLWTLSFANLEWLGGIDVLRKAPQQAVERSRLATEKEKEQGRRVRDHRAKFGLYHSQP